MISSISSISSSFNGINASVSGINAGRIVQSIAALNIANVNSKDYQAYNAELSSSATGGVLATVSLSEQPPLQYVEANGTTTTLSNVDLLEEIVDLKLGEVMVNANAAAYKIQSDSIGTIIDMIA